MQENQRKEDVLRGDNRFTRAIAQRICPFCGVSLAYGRFLCDDPECKRRREARLKQEDDERRKEFAEQEIEIHMRRVQQLFDSSGLIRYQDVTFDKLDRVKDNRDAVEGLESFARELRRQTKNRVFVLCGETGNGKTYAAAALMNAAARKRVKCGYCSGRYASEIWPREEAKKPEKESARKRRIALKEARLIVVDDLNYISTANPISRYRFCEWFNQVLDQTYNNDRYRLMINFEGNTSQFKAFDLGLGMKSALSRLQSMSECIFRVTCGDWRTRVRDLAEG